MAFYGSLGEVNYGALDASITDTAVDIFVYDTSKDSDGGAWRHRTQHTSWYNETLNTATRGSRREFPAVAVIVVQNADPMITIYDGDDPDLPMWMVFRNHISGGGNDQTLYTTYYAAGPYQTRKVAMLNGIMVDCQYRTSGHVGGVVKGVTRFNFIDDSSTMMTDEGDFKRNGNLGDERNTIKSYTKISTTTIVHTQCNDVAMTVLPNAPIDSTTGLPIPTIAVATQGGTSIIKDDGTVVDLKRSSGSFTNTVQFTDNNSIMLVWGHASDAIRHINHYSYADWQSDQNDYDQSTGYNELPQFGSGALQSPLKTTASGIVPGVLVNLNGQNRMSAKWDDYGLKIADLNDSNRANGMVTFITTSYSSGIMSGDIKGAFLSDTDTTAASSSSLISGNNSTFGTGTGNWSAPYQSTIAAVNGQLEITATAGNPYASLTVTVEVGKTYRFDIQSISNNFSTAFNVHFGNVSGLAQSQYGSINIANAASYNKYFTATTTTLNVQIAGNGSVGQVGTIDNVFLYELEEDRSVNNKGLQVFGTITKSAVATGADLVAYSGFNNSNYLEQPYNSSLDFGTGDFSFMCWSKNTGAYEGFFGYGNNSSSAGSLYVQTGNTFDSFRIAVNGAQRPTSSSGLISLSTWNFMTVVRKSGIIYCYHNATQFATITDLTASIGNTNNTLRIGVLGNLSVSHGIGDDALDTGSISLLRLSASAPSPEQIKKIYEDEKVLFQENAACTLYGSSDAVTALAYDDFNDLLHVGTSSGRSDFQGLRRINNTTTAVSTAISASNGLIAEQ